MRVRAVLLLVLIAASAAAREPVPIAVSSNFLPTFTELAASFEAQTGIRATARSGSTGQLYAQIINGAPYAAFLAADSERPEALVRAGYGIADTRFTYALGRLVVWSMQADDCLAALHDRHAGRVALANPEVAPYGIAAREFLQAIEAWFPERNVFGANAMQALSFAVTGNAVVAVVPRAQLAASLTEKTRCTYEVPGWMHEPIGQQAVLLDKDDDEARRFLDFLRSAAARAIIAGAGYEVPE